MTIENINSFFMERVFVCVYGSEDNRSKRVCCNDDVIHEEIYQYILFGWHQLIKKFIHGRKTVIVVYNDRKNIVVMEYITFCFSCLKKEIVQFFERIA